MAGAGKVGHQGVACAGEVGYQGIAGTGEVGHQGIAGAGVGAGMGKQHKNAGDMDVCSLSC